jgi:hypothetical protein
MSVSLSLSGLGLTGHHKDTFFIHITAHHMAEKWRVCQQTLLCTFSPSISASLHLRIAFPTRNCAPGGGVSQVARSREHNLYHCWGRLGKTLQCSSHSAYMHSVLRRYQTEHFHLRCCFGCNSYWQWRRRSTTGKKNGNGSQEINQMDVPTRSRPQSQDEAHTEPPSADNDPLHILDSLPKWKKL